MTRLDGHRNRQTMTSPDSITNAIDALKVRAKSNPRLSIENRVRLCRECLSSVINVADEWMRTAAAGKLSPNDPSVMAEELLSGPIIVARQLQLTIQTLQAISVASHPRLPCAPIVLRNGQLSIPVFPTSGFYDGLTFFGLSGCVRMPQGVTKDEIHGQRIEVARNGVLSGITAVLGAGNVSSIPATDSLNRIMFDGRQVVLKLNPVNQNLAGIFERAFAPLAREGLLRTITGAADVGGHLIHHPAVDDVHITGSVATHNSIVWGSTPVEIERRKQSNDRLLKKTVSSELGNVTPWVIVPGRYSNGELHSQAQHFAASITNNASFNCLTTRVIVTWNRWEQRETFLDLVKHYMSKTPLRPAWYPGAVERYQRFAANDVAPDNQNRLPWTLLTNQSHEQRPDLFREESFACVCAETALEAMSPVDFLARATDFVNERVFGTLCASVTLPSHFRRDSSADVESCLERLRYGAVCINQWSGLAYGFVSPPWGAYPGATIENVESGIGSVHNTYLLDRFEKTVLEGPLINFPKPVWFPNHKRSLSVANRLLSLYARPSLTRLPPLFAAALMG